MILERTIRFKFSFNGAKNYKDLQLILNQLKKQFREYKKLGIKYSCNIDDYHTFWMKPKTEKEKKKLEKLGFDVISYRL